MQQRNSKCIIRIYREAPTRERQHLVHEVPVHERQIGGRTARARQANAASSGQNHSLLRYRRKLSHMSTALRIGSRTTVLIGSRGLLRASRSASSFDEVLKRSTVSTTHSKAAVHEHELFQWWRIHTASRTAATPHNYTTEIACHANPSTRSLMFCGGCTGKCIIRNARTRVFMN